MTSCDGRVMGEAVVGTTRREALRFGSAAALALVAAGMGGRSVVAAQEASPEASPAAGDGLEGRYVVIRFRQFLPEQDVDEAMDLIREGFVPLVREIEGFVSYIGVTDPASQASSFIGIYADKAGADESNRVAAEWLQENGYEFFEGDPVVAEGVIGIAAEAEA